MVPQCRRRRYCLPILLRPSTGVKCGNAALKTSYKNFPHFSEHAFLFFWIEKFFYFSFTTLLMQLFLLDKLQYIDTSALERWYKSGDRIRQRRRRLFFEYIIPLFNSFRCLVLQIEPNGNHPESQDKIRLASLISVLRDHD